ncbi:MAG: TIGR00282 family metallophosphoesterase [Syntrophales bacterium]|nr:TIGR00282 family metallophosphoesterase [Syntrophales bacterium]MDD5532183.1 TIGR00282 family metallophosphoesterase [Syntrophales bacterium]
MRILFIGDIVGKPGRRAVRELLPGIVCDKLIDIVVANGENAAGGFGLTREVVEELFQNGIHVLTSGNHVWDKKETESFINDYDALLRPANYPEGVPGHGSTISRTPAGINVGIINLMGRVFMFPIDNPFRRAEQEILAMRGKADVILVDFHAEATSEKEALGRFLDGRVSAVLGTHTHVQTADEQVFPGGTAYITDAGMTGPFDSIIGISIERALGRFLTAIPQKFDVARQDVRLQGVIVDVDEQTGGSRGIERISLRLEERSGGRRV